MVEKGYEKVLVLLSGGLDSRLALVIMKDLIKKENVEAVFFDLPFNSKSPKKEIEKFCKQQEINLKVFEVTKEPLLSQYFSIVQSPKYQRGTALNPCIDCKIWIFNIAKQYASEKNIKTIVTGEVLGERPLSQNKKALNIIEEVTQLQGHLLRPLSAKSFPETEIEKQKIIGREKLENIVGRSRKRQIELAEKYKIEFPTPGGGCLLCEKEYCKKLKHFLSDKLEENMIEILKFGRHFKESNIILARNQQEGERIEANYKKYKKGILLIPIEPGPTAWISSIKHKDQAIDLIKKYSKNKVKNIEVIQQSS